MKKDSKSEPSANLQKQAEAVNRKRPLKSSSSLDDTKMRKLIQELETHQIELELQNEELRLAKAQITAYAEKYAELYDFAPLGYFTLANNSEIIELNLCGSQMLGKERTVLKTQRFGLYVSDDDKPVFNRFLDKVFSSKSTETCEIALLVNGTPPIYVNLSGTVTENGKQCLVMATDITDRKLSEVALRESNEMFSAFMRHSPIYAFIKEVNQDESRVLRASENYRDMIGISGSEMAGKTMYELFPAEFAAKFTADDWKVVSGGEGITLDEDLNGRNYTSVKFPIDLGGKTLLAGYTIDITEHKEALQKIENQHALLKALINSPKDIIIFSLDRNYCYTAFNEKHREEMKRVWKVDIEVEMNLLSCMPEPELQKLAKQSIDRALRGESFSEIQHQPEHDIYFEFSWNPIMQNDEVVGITVFIRDITEKKKTEELIRESEERYRNLMTNLEAGVVVHAPDTSIIMNNQRAAELLGLSDVKMKGRLAIDPNWKFVDEKNVPLIPSEYPVNRIIAAQKPFSSFLLGVVRPEKGNVVWLTVNGFPVFDNQGKIAEVLISFIDITERKLAEQTLLESERKFRNTVANLDEGYYNVTMDGVLIEHNQAFCRILGFDSNADLKGVHLSDLWQHPEKRKEYLDVLSANGAVSNFQIDIKTQSGENRSVLASAHLVKSKDKQTLWIEGIFLDITERIRMEESLRRHADRLQNLHKIDKEILSPLGSPEAIIQNSLQHIRSLLSSQHASIGIFDFENDALQLFIAGIKDQSVAKVEKYMIDKAYGDLEILQQNRMNVIEDISAKSSPPELLRILQSEGIMSCINVPLVSGEKLIGAMNLGWADSRAFTPEELEIASEVADEITIAIEQVRLRQITKQYASDLEKRVEERTAQLTAANKELEAFSYSVSHDLRAPLRHINGYISILSKHLKDKLPEKEKRYFDTISESAHQMGVLIDDLLQFSRTGRQEMKLTDLDMNAVLQDALQVIKHESNGRNIKWKIAPLPQAVGDYALLRLVWLNLLSNAVKFSKANVLPQIEIGVIDNDNEFVFFVRDNGVGFDMKYAQKLFGVFERLHSTQEFEGTGIGLANVRRIISRHGGRTWAEAEVDKGAAFYFTLPKKQ